MVGRSKGGLLVKGLTARTAEVLLEAVRNPLVFALLFLGFVPDIYQTRILLAVKEGYRRLVLVTGRQFGKTTITAVIAAWYAFTHKNKMILCTAPTKPQASIVFNRIKEFIGRNPLLASMVVRETRTEIWLSNGSRIFVKPAWQDAKSVRGLTVDMLIVDEAAFIHENAWVVLTPTQATKGEDAYTILLSTPFGKSNYFARAYMDSLRPDSRWKSFRYPSTVCPRISREYLRMEFERLSEIDFRREYLAEFVEEESLYFPPSLLQRVLRDYRLIRPEDLGI